MALARFSFAGWQVIPSGTEETLNAGAFANPDTGWLVGSRGTCLRTEDAGLTWKKTALGVGNELTGVHFTDARQGFICGAGGLILRTTDAGRTWEKAATPDTGRITDVSFASPAVGFAMGKYDSLLATSDSGKTWSARKIYDGPKPAVNSIRACFPTEKIGYLISLVQVFRTEDGGATWNPSPGMPWGASYLADCWFAHPDTGFIAAVTNGSMLRTDDGGRSMRMVPGNPTNRVRFLNRNLGFSMSVTQIQRSVNGGADWIPEAHVYDFVKSGVSLRALAVNGASVALVAGNKGFLIRHVEEPATVTGLRPYARHPSASSRSGMRKANAVRLDGRAIPSSASGHSSRMH